MPIEISKNDSGNVIDLLIIKNHYATIKKLKVFSGDHNKNFICRRCLNSFTSENMLEKHKTKCENNVITLIRTSPDSHLHWKKKHFHKNPLYFRIYAGFEAANEIDKSKKSSKTTIIYKQNAILSGYYIKSELNDFLKKSVFTNHL